MMLKRRGDWRTQFEEVVDDIMRLPFSWETQHDCAVGLAGRLIEAMTGVDLVAPYRGKYSDEEGALATLRAAGFRDLADLVRSLLPEIHPSAARIGDLAAFPVDHPFRSTLGVVNGERVVVLTPRGVGTMNLLQAHRAFRVG